MIVSGGRVADYGRTVSTVVSGGRTGHTTQINTGRDTLLTLTDGSTILIKGSTDLDHGFFD